MKIFENNLKNATDSSDVKKSKGNGPAKKGSKPVIDKTPMSANEIREKLAANAELSNSAKSKVAQNSKQLGAGFMNDKAIPATTIVAPQLSESTSPEVEKTDDPNTPDHLIKSDVGKNDPADSATTEKLKTVLTKGAFNFNSKERETLERILADQ